MLSFPRISRDALFGNWIGGGLLLYMAGFFLTPDHNVHKRFFYFLVVAPCLMAILFYRQLFRTARREQLVAFSFIGLLAVPLLWSPEFSGASLERVVRDAFYLATLVLAVRFLIATEPKTLQRLQWVLMISASIAGLYLVGEFLLTADQWQQAVLIPEWRFHNQNRMAKCFGVIAMLSLLLLALPQSRFDRLAAAPALLIAIVVVLLSRSKGATYALVLSVLALLLIQPTLRQQLLRFWPGTVVLVALIGLAGWQFGTVTDFMRDGWSRRDIVWTAVLDSFRSHPLIGTGYLLDTRLYGSDSITYWHEHNLFLALLRQSGLIGLAISLAALAALIYRVAHLNDERKHLWLTLLVYGVLATQSGDRYPLQGPEEMWLWFWIPVAVLLALAADSNPGASVESQR